MTRPAVLALLLTLPSAAPGQPAATKPAPADRPAIGWMAGGGPGEDGSSAVVDMAVFGDIPVGGHTRFRLEAGLMSWDFDSAVYRGAPGLSGAEREAIDRDAASVRRIGVHVQRRLPWASDDPLVPYVGFGIGNEFWRFDRNTDEDANGPRLEASLGMEFLTPQGRLGIVGEMRLAWFGEPAGIDRLMGAAITFLGGLKWRLTAP